MESQASDKAPKASGLIRLSEHRQMDRLAEILEKLPPDRQEAFGEGLEDPDNVGKNEVADETIDPK